LRAWRAATWRRACPAQRAVSLPAGIGPGRLLAQGTGASGGEHAGRDRARAWLDGPVKGYPGGHDNLAVGETSRLSTYLRFGCVSALALARDALTRPGGEEFARQLAWRDFFHQVTAAFPDIATENYRPGMRQLAADGFDLFTG
jgi:deoxyribodipyrimidine photo-lyase